MAEFTSRLSPNLTAKAIVPVAKDTSGVSQILGQGVSNLFQMGANIQKGLSDKAERQEESNVKALEDQIAGASLAADFERQDMLAQAVETQQAAQSGQVDRSSAEINLRSTVQTLLNHNPEYAAEIYDYLKESGIESQVFRPLRMQQAREEAIYEAETTRRSEAIVLGRQIYGSNLSDQEALSLGETLQNRIQIQSLATEEAERIARRMEAGEKISNIERTSVYRTNTQNLTLDLDLAASSILNDPDFNRYISNDPTMTPQERSGWIQTVTANMTAFKAEARRLRANDRISQEQMENVVSHADSYMQMIEDLQGKPQEEVTAMLEFIKSQNDYILENSAGPLFALQRAGFIPPELITHLFTSGENEAYASALSDALAAGISVMSPFMQGVAPPQTEEEMDLGLTELNSGLSFDLGTILGQRARQTSLAVIDTAAQVPTFEVNPLRAANMLEAGMSTGFQTTLTSSEDRSVLLNMARKALTGARSTGPGWGGASRGAEGTWETRLLSVTTLPGSAVAPENNGLKYDESTGQFVWVSGVSSYQFSPVGRAEVMSSTPTRPQQAAMDTLNRGLEYFGSMMVEEGYATDINHAKGLLTGTNTAPPLGGPFVGSITETEQAEQPQAALDAIGPMLQNSALSSRPDSMEAQELRQIQTRIDQFEGQGDYNKLWNNSEVNPESVMAGVMVSELTFAELDQLEEAYGAEVQETNPDQGVFATPMGRYQIVGTTRRELAQQMGLPPTTKFTPQVQDLMFERLVGRRRQQAMNSDLTFEQALQLEWPGLTRG